jgi:thiamine pyrophosphate-dependent acetolactate synthase large subunit-like protein
MQFFHVNLLRDVVINDAQLGMVRQGQGDLPIASEFVRTDWAGIAEGYGAVGLRVKNPGEVKCRA